MRGGIAEQLFEGFVMILDDLALLFVDGSTGDFGSARKLAGTVPLTLDKEFAAQIGHLIILPPAGGFDGSAVGICREVGNGAIAPDND